MTNQEIVAKLWNLCNILRDDGITYHQYVTELTYILFLKMAKETNAEENIARGVAFLEKDKKVEKEEKQMLIEYSWDKLAAKTGSELKDYYNRMLKIFGKYCKGLVKEIYFDAHSNIQSSTNLELIIRTMDRLDWYSAKEEGLGNLYEGLLAKNADEKKSGAGQYFTPRPLIDVMVRMIKPEVGEKCNDPACGTFGFMIAADRYIKEKTDNLNELSEEERDFQINSAFSGCELVSETYRLALMNAMLHDIHAQIYCGNTLTEELGKREELQNLDVVLSNPPFGTKKGGELANRKDFMFSTSNKQFNFLQHIYHSLNTSGKARAAVVVPDNVLFADGDGESIRCELMDKCNLHTILRLPTGIFYAQGVKTNVLFFTRGKSDYCNTKEVWFYDLRTDMPSYGKTTPLKLHHFAEFELAYNASKREDVCDSRWTVYSREEIRNNGNSLDLGLIQENVDIDETISCPIEGLEICMDNLEEARKMLSSVIEELKSLGV